MTRAMRELECLTGVVRLTGATFGILGTVTPAGCTPVYVTQTCPPPPGGVPLIAVDGRTATLCGTFRRRKRYRVLDVRTVHPLPSPSNIPGELLLLMLPLLLTQKAPPPAPKCPPPAPKCPPPAK